MNGISVGPKESVESGVIYSVGSWWNPDGEQGLSEISTMNGGSKIFTMNVGTGDP
jgi:hypothetical protein